MKERVRVIKQSEYGHDTLSLSYYSVTWDVIAMRGEEDDACAVILASFGERAHAHAFAKSCGEYVLMVRPPHEVMMQLADVLDVYRALWSADGMEVKRITQ